ncbi:putative transcriptional regulator [uncultured Mediterranean phage uvMED]|nr:putative transcriptional regulator [uncultured Mediterranean phage uvMED]BAR15018.1 probable transcriptional regulator [uncultured Mediterranean phage uvMED]
MAMRKNDDVIVSFEKAFRSEPRNGAKWETYSLVERLRVTNGKFTTVTRTKRQRGKIEEAQRYRKYQGVYLKTRLHFFNTANHSQSQLRWWFANSRRTRIHHFIMHNYYLEDRPTTEEELLEQNFGSRRQVALDLKTAQEMGAIEIDQDAADKRKKVIYVTRGLVADTDNLFGSDDEQRPGMYTVLCEGLATHVSPEYRLADYAEDRLKYKQMIEATLPDSFRPF